MADEWVVWVVLRVHLSCKRHAADNVHSEAAETPGNETGREFKIDWMDCPSSIVYEICVHL